MSEPAQPSNILARMAALAGIDQQSEHANLTADTLRRARWARDHNDHYPNGAWSTGEQLIVALVLNNFAHLTDMDFEPDEAAKRVAGGMYFPPADIDTFIADIRRQL